MSDVTELLRQWNGGDAAAREQLVERIYGELHQVAERYIARERSAPDLQPTLLVHEAYLRLVDVDNVDWQSRAHFLGIAARIMREYLVDNARRRRAKKRDHGVQVTYHEPGIEGDQPQTDLLELNDALERLAKADPPRALLVELRFFGGLTIEETAHVLEQSPATVKRSWQVARAWLYQEMQRGDD